MQGGCHSMPPLQSMRTGTIGKKPSSEGIMSETKTALETGIIRFTRLDEQTENRIAALDTSIIRSMARRREATIEIGRALNELKRILGHGAWQRHFAETFAPGGLTLRTAERYMKRAGKEDAALEIENDSVSIMKQATDGGAQQMREVTLQEQAKVKAASGHNKPKKEPLRVYRLPLHMTGEEREAMDAMLKLPNWPHAETQIISLLRRFWTEHGILHKSTGGRS
jgi:hypothetical protein